MKLSNLFVPLVIILLGVLTWVGGNLLGDRQGGTNIALTLIGIGGGLAKQDNKSAVTGGTIETVNVEGGEK
jgi:hypothetical protein